MDVLFLLKEYPKQAIVDLPWPGPVKVVGLDPPEALKCKGVDPLCSTAYSAWWQALGGKQGVVPALLARYAPEATGRVAFLGFSAAHGLLNPLLANPADRARVSAVLLMDASFGGGKTGYVEAVKAAARGELLLVSATSYTGGDASWSAVWDQAEDELGQVSEQVSVPEPMLAPAGGAFRLGSNAYYLRYVDPQNPQSGNLSHNAMGKWTAKMLEAYLVPYWRGASQWLLMSAAVAVSALVFWLVSRRRGQGA